MNYHLILNIPQLCVEVYCKKIKAVDCKIKLDT